MGRSLKGRGLCAGWALVAACLSPTGATADAVAEFYKGKEIRMIIGEGPGGGYDTHARLLGAHMARHIPGAPTIIAQNMPGAGTLNAVNHIYAVAPKDGTVIGTAQRFIFIMPLLGLEGAKFEAERFSFVGSTGQDIGTCIAWAESGFKTIEDVKAREFAIATGGAGAQLTTFAAALTNTLGLKLKLIKGYKSGQEMNLAMERREVDGRCGVSYSSLNLLNDWMRNGRVHVLIQLGLDRQPELGNVPLLLDLVTEPRDKMALEVLMMPTKIARPFFGPPGIPAERLAALRQAFDRTMADPAFRADARARNLEISPVSGGEMEGLVKRMRGLPDNVVARAKELVAE